MNSDWRAVHCHSISMRLPIKMRQSCPRGTCFSHVTWTFDSRRPKVTGPHVHTKLMWFNSAKLFKNIFTAPVTLIFDALSSKICWLLLIRDALIRIIARDSLINCSNMGVFIYHSSLALWSHLSYQIQSQASVLALSQYTAFWIGQWKWILSSYQPKQ